MKNKFTILGCGSSIGSPWITGNWGLCNKNNKKNIRTRCSAHFLINNVSILIDTSPDIKSQLANNKIIDLDSVLFTHEHADHTSGIFELRPFFWKYKKTIKIYGERETVKDLKKRYDYCFKFKNGYVPILTPNIIKNKFKIISGKKIININCFPVDHGMIKSTAYVIEKIAYISDCNKIFKKNFKDLANLKYLIIDCLKLSEHPSHLNLSKALELVKILKPKKTILTNLHTDLDYTVLKKKLPKNIMPAYDGLSFNF